MEQKIGTASSTQKGGSESVCVYKAQAQTILFRDSLIMPSSVALGQPRKAEDRQKEGEEAECSEAHSDQEGTAQSRDGGQSVRHRSR